MADPTNAPRTVGRPEVELEDEIAARDEEILRLRDLLIGKDAELGVLRGQVAVMEQHSRLVASILTRLPVPGLRRLVASLLRRLRG